VFFVFIHLSSYIYNELIYVFDTGTTGFLQIPSDGEVLILAFRGNRLRFRGGQIAHARTFLNCEKVFLEMATKIAIFTPPV